MKKTILIYLFSAASLLAFGQDTTSNPLDPVKDLLLKDFKKADLLKNVKTRKEAVDLISKNKSNPLFKLTDSIDIQMEGANVKSIKIYAQSDEYDSANEFFTIKNPNNEKELAIDLNAKMNIVGKTKQPNDQKQIEDIIAKDTKTGYMLIFKKSR